MIASGEASDPILDYSEVASEVWIILPPRTDPDKSFAPCSEVDVVGGCLDLLQMMVAVHDSRLVTNGNIIHMMGSWFLVMSGGGVSACNG